MRQLKLIAIISALLLLCLRLPAQNTVQAIPLPDSLNLASKPDSLGLTGQLKYAQAKPDSLIVESADSLKLKSSGKYRGYTPEFLDTVQIKKSFVLNDYTLIGVEYGASMSRMLFNPTRLQTSIIAPNTFGIYLTRYGKLFNYIPNFGFKIGLRYGHEGYKFKENKETKVISDIEGATQALMQVAELPFMAHFHLDLLHFKVMLDAGIYGGYRLSIERTGDAVPEEIRTAFLETDKRFDYGLSGGLGFALVFDPVEFHVNAGARYSWATIYEPDYYHKDYYRFAYPLDIMLTAGVYFQLTKRTGKSKPQLRREAYRQVYTSPTAVEKAVRTGGFEQLNHQSNGTSGSESR